jgi:dihydrofolate synthase / folylpolyglutamate synthase
MKFVHIAGTNGKGSVAEYISNILTASGLRCGCYTSPHLILPSERIRIDGECISGDELARLFAEINEKRLAVNDTQFAAYTAAALLWFARECVDIAVMETGLGGRLDPTNYIQPDVTVLTSIDYDHTDVLGNTLVSIAKEKCGIIKPGVPVVSAIQHETVKKIIDETCEEKGSSLEFAENVKRISCGLYGQTFDFEGCKYLIDPIGIVQPENAALSVLAAKALGVKHESIREGLKRTRLVCRTQYIKGVPDMLLDGGHNPAATEVLVRTLDKYFSDRRKVLLFACMKNKDYGSMIKEIRGVFSNVIVTQADTSRGEPAEELKKLFSGTEKCGVEENPAEAFAEARNIAKEQGALLVVGGSFYLAGYVYSIINKTDFINNSINGKN